MNPLKQLEACGQSPWLDYVRRDLMAKGELRTLIERDGLKGMTSNPAIFEKAIGHSDDYADDLRDFQKGADHGVMALYEHAAIADIRSAADGLRPVYDATDGRDGYISLEVSPYLAHDTEATVAEARRLWKTVDRRNLMVKVPATPAGIPAIRTLIGEGLNINVTLLFAVPVYVEVAKAYIAGLQDLVAGGGDPSHSASVASFFVSRIDTLIDKKLEGMGETALQGNAAIANAKIAYARYKELFSGSEWEALSKKGAKSQRLLWASTSVKNKNYKDTLYVEELIGRDTVNTMPPATMDAYRDHGTIKRDSVEADLAGAERDMAALKAKGIDIEAVAKELVADGVTQFADAFDALLGTVAQRRRTLFEGGHVGLEIKPGSDAFKAAYDKEMDAWRAGGKIRRLWASDASLWTGTDEAGWTGWLTIVEREQADVKTLQDFAKEVKGGGYTDVVLLGMGGSSLGPEVLSETFGRQAGFPQFHMLDSTDPAQVRALLQAAKLETTLCIVSSKSGSTLEPNIFMATFYDAIAGKVGRDKVGRHFVAVTDPGSSMEKEAKARGFTHVFHGDKTIGGRYSVLSKFGLVPAAAIGLDVAKFLDLTEEMVRGCSGDVPPAENPGTRLGVAMGVAARDFKRDKVTLIASPGIGDLGAWLEQLIAESTGKEGHGLIPVDAEPVAAPDHYGQDRFFAYLELADGVDAGQRRAVEALAAAGHPVAMIAVPSRQHVGQEFFRWEIATAVAGSIIGIDPFNQPDVEASKVKTRALTSEYEKTGTLPSEEPVFRENGVAIFADDKNAAALGKHNSLVGYLRSHLGRVSAGDYVALLAYVQRDKAHIGTLSKTRIEIRDRMKAATCLGFGPRFLHSTGQAYKGGPNSGVFLQITCDDAEDMPVPDAKYSFGVVKAAQARGDLDVLNERGRRSLRVHLKDVESGLQELARAVSQAIP